MTNRRLAALALLLLSAAASAASQIYGSGGYASCDYGPAKVPHGDRYTGQQKM